MLNGIKKSFLGQNSSRTWLGLLRAFVVSALISFFVANIVFFLLLRHWEVIPAGCLIACFLFIPIVAFLFFQRFKRKWARQSYLIFLLPEIAYSLLGVIVGIFDNTMPTGGTEIFFALFITLISGGFCTYWYLIKTFKMENAETPGGS